MKAGTMAAAPRAAMLPQAVPVEVTKLEETTGTVFQPRLGQRQHEQKLRPTEDEAEHGGGSDPALGHRQDHAPEDQPARGAVDQSAFVDILRDVVEEALQQQTASGRFIRAWIRMTPR